MKKLINGLKGIFFGLSYGMAILFMFAIVLYIVETNFGKDGEPVGFQLATISAIVGGLILASAFFDKASSDSGLRLNLRRIGVIYLVATIAFVVFGICFPIMDTLPYITYVTAVSMVAGAMSFAMGTVLLVREIPRLWSDSEK